jgi:hypothetical protein
MHALGAKRRRPCQCRPFDGPYKMRKKKTEASAHVALGVLGWRGEGSDEEINFGKAMATWSLLRADQSMQAHVRVCWGEMQAWAEKGVSPFFCKDKHPSAFQKAVTSGSLEALALVAKAAGAELAERIDEVGQDGDDPRGNREMGTVLCDAWAGSLKSQESCEPMIRRLVEMGAKPDGCVRSPGMALRNMLQVRDVDAMRALIELGADPLLRDCHGNTLMHLAVSMSRPLGAAWSVLEEAGVDPWAKNNKGRTLFDGAIAVHQAWLQAKRERWILESDIDRPRTRVSQCPRI